MKRIFIAAMLSIAAAGTALAADLPQPPPPQAPVAYLPTVAPVYNWGGIYVGINGGWGWGNGNGRRTQRPAPFPQMQMTTAVSWAGRWALTFRPARSCSVLRAIGIIPASTPGQPVPSASFPVTAKLVTIGSARCADDLVGLQIACCSMAQPAVLLPMCKQTLAVPLLPEHKPAGPPALARNGPLLTTGPRRSNISTSISATAM